MIDSRWLRTVCISVVMAGFLPGIATAQTFPSANNSTTSARQPVDVLSDLNSTPDARDLAALQLVAPKDSMAKSAVLDLFRSGPEGSKLALAKALGTLSWPDPDFEPPLMALLAGRDEAPKDAAAALAQYGDDPAVMQALIIQAHSGRADIRVPVIQALGAFGHHDAAQELVNLLEHGDAALPADSEAIREAAGDALIAMTGQTDLDHNALLWDQWWQKNKNLPDNAFHNSIVQSRGEAFEGQLAHYKALKKATEDLLTSNFWSAPQGKQAGILLGYLQSSAPEIRALGANLVLQIARSGPPPPAALAQTLVLLSDPSPMVRAAAAQALQADYDSAAALVAQLGRETDDLVRVRILKSLPPGYQPAIAPMLNLVGSGQSDMVRIAAADGLAAASQQINKEDPKSKQNAIDTLKKALEDTDAPGESELRAAIVGALSGISDQQLSEIFVQLILPNETPEVRAKALVGLGNLPKPDPYGRQISRIMLDNNDPTNLRLAAVQALQHVPPEGYIDPMLDRMTNDPDDQVRQQAWYALRAWANEPDLDEQALIQIADGLKGDPAKQLEIRTILCNRLAADAQNAALSEDQRKQKAQVLAEQEQNVGDLLVNPPLNRPLDSAGHYRKALDYWKANGGQADVIYRLCRDLVEAYLSAKHWDDAANFVAEVVRDYENDPNLPGALPVVAGELQNTAANFVDSRDPSAYTDAMAMFDAIQKMNPPLPGNYMNQLQIIKDRIESQHGASSRPGP